MNDPIEAADSDVCMSKWLKREKEKRLLVIG